MAKVYESNGDLYVERDGEYLVLRDNGRDAVVLSLPDGAAELINADVAREDAYNEGYNDGYEEGTSEGYNEDDLEREFERGYEDGKFDGRTEGYDEGYDDGLLAGREEADD